MLRRANRDVPLGAVDQAVVGLFVKIALYNGKVQLPLVQQLQQLLGVSGEHVQLDVRFPLQQPVQRSGHDVLPNGQGGAKAQTAAGILLMDRLPQPEIIVVHGGGGAEKEPAALCELELLPLAAEQLGAVLLLQGADVLRHRGLSDVELLRQADIVVTNPPFSLFREYVAQLVKYEKKFLIIGNKNALTYKEIFPLIMQNKLWTGYRGFSGGMWFKSTYEGKTEKFVDGEKLINVPSIWYTNLDHKKRHEEFIFYKKYTPEEYPKYDNYDAINVDKTLEIPEDYNGVMGVPITFLDKYNPEQFEIVRFRKGNDEKDLSINGKCPYFRILIRRKQ